MYRKYIKDSKLLKKLEELNEKKYELKSLINKQKEKTPFVVELSGMPRTGKTVSSERIFEFFKMANYTILRTKEPAQIVKERYDITKLSNVEFNDKTLEISKEQLEDCISKKPDIILQDRGIFDNYIWYQMMFEKGEIDFQVYQEKMKDLNSSIEVNDILYLMTADPEVIVQRDYSDQIFLEPRKKTTIDGVTMLRNGMEDVVLQVNSDRLVELDTTNINEVDTAIIISNNIIDGMTKKLTLKNM